MWSSFSSRENSVPCMGRSMKSKRRLNPSRSGTTTPMWPRNFCASRFGKWNCCSPTLIHMLNVPKSMYGSRVKPKPVT